MSYGPYHMASGRTFPLFSENKITLRRNEYIMTAMIPAKIGEMNQDDT